MVQTPQYAGKMTELAQIASPFFDVMQRIEQIPDNPNICDFAFGNPQDMALPGYVAALKKWSTPTSQD